MDIPYAIPDLEVLCTDERKAKRKLGPQSFKKLVRRLADLVAAVRVTDLVAGHPHPLTGDRYGQFALDLEGGWRVIFRPVADPPPEAPDGGIAWNQVTAILIVAIEDYHE